MNTPLQQAAQAMIGRWDSPLWKDQPHTGVYIEELRKALDAELHVPEVGFGNIVEPEAWTWDTAGTGWTMTGCVEAHFAFNKPHPDKCILNLRPLYLHPPQQVAVTSGERAELLRDLNAWKDSGTKTVGYLIGKAMDMLEANAQPPAPTGWDNGLSQDYCKELGQWLASRPGARQQVKEMFEADLQQAKQVPMTTEQITRAWESVKGTSFGYAPFARTIEAHHGIGGEA